jgi:hypothetical protein
MAKLLCFDSKTFFDGYATALQLCAGGKAGGSCSDAVFMPWRITAREE